MNETAIGLGVGGGVVFGAVMLAVTGEAFWMGVGIAIGAGIGVTFSQQARKGGSSAKDEEENE